jgi:hypothetical protein
VEKIMSRARHKRENGGPVKQVWEAGGETNAAKESEGKELKKGGRAEGKMAKMRMDKPRHRATGGRLRGMAAGADKAPLTTASKVKHVTKGETDESGSDKVM